MFIWQVPDSNSEHSPGNTLAQSPGPPRFPSARSPQSSGSPRFPSGRVSRTSGLSSSSALPSDDLQPSLAAKGHPSPSKSAGSFPTNNLSNRPQQAFPSPFIRPIVPSTRRDKLTSSPSPRLPPDGWKPKTPTGAVGVAKGTVVGGAKGAPHRRRANTDSVFSNKPLRDRNRTEGGYRVG